MKHIWRWLISVCTVLSAGEALAVDLANHDSLTVTGFYSLTGAKIIAGRGAGGNALSKYGEWNCPCAIATSEYGGVYEHRRSFTFDQESLLGLQIQKEILPVLSMTVQMVSRLKNPAHGSTPTIDWLYATLRPSSDSPWKFQAGKMRIPLYYYSDYLHIGYAYPWVRPSTDVYGQPVYAYHGANASYRTRWGTGNWEAEATAWGGNNSASNKDYISALDPSKSTSQAWKRIMGGWVSLGNGVIQMRAMAMRMNDTVWEDLPQESRNVLVNNSSSQVLGLAFNADYENWFLKTDINRYQSEIGEYRYGLASVGYQWSNWTPAYTYAGYRTNQVLGSGRSTHTLSLRWDVHDNTAVKVQYDTSREALRSTANNFGDYRLVSISLQGIF